MSGLQRLKRKITTKRKILLDLSATISASRLTYSSIAESSDIAVNNFVHWFTDQTEPRLKELEKVAAFLGYEIRLVPCRPSRPQEQTTRGKEMTQNTQIETKLGIAWAELEFQRIRDAIAHGDTNEAFEIADRAWRQMADGKPASREVAVSSEEPVTWQWTWKSATEDDGWAYTETAPTGFGGQRTIEPLFASPAVVPVARVKDETGWLIELRGNEPKWWSLDYNPEPYWTKDANRALRFARKDDAEAYIAGTGWTEAFATEHMWLSPPILSLIIPAPKEEAASEQPGFTYYECPECGFDVIHRADYEPRSTACPICAGDSGHDVGMNSRTARATDKPEGKDARSATLAQDKPSVEHAKEENNASTRI